jgi:CMP-N,N'-diacetyllegionaminic acid synthase
MNSIVALIPARGGSKGISRKNIKNLNGKPLIAYTIDAALSSDIIDRTIVTTDDEEIAQISMEYGAEVPYIRPKELAGDTVRDFPVIKHAIDYLNEYEKQKVKIVVWLRPTSPVRIFGEINAVVKKLIENTSADCVRTTRPAVYPPFWMKRINENGYLEPYHSHVEKYVSSRRQELPQIVMCDGSIEAVRVESIIKQGEFPPKRKLPYYRDNLPFIDLDTEEDWAFCEYFMKNNKLFS